jgi:hypothetical protein
MFEAGWNSIKETGRLVGSVCWLVLAWALAGAPQRPKAGAGCGRGIPSLTARRPLNRGRPGPGLWQYRTAVAAMRLGQFDEARALVG